MAKCKECIHKDVCYLKEHYGKDLCSDEACDKFLATPVVHGRWIWDNSPEFGNPYGSYKCSECKERQSFKENYCPNCGAKMDGDRDD